MRPHTTTATAVTLRAGAINRARASVARNFVRKSPALPLQTALRLLQAQLVDYRHAQSTLLCPIEIRIKSGKRFITSKSPIWPEKLRVRENSSEEILPFSLS